MLGQIRYQKPNKNKAVTEWSVRKENQGKAVSGLDGANLH
jgi:hypothetical protein